MRHIILIGFKHVGKSTLGSALAAHLNKPFIDLDTKIEEHYAMQNNQALSCREIMTIRGEAFFRAEETSALSKASQAADAIIALGGGAALTKNNQNLIHAHQVILIEAEKKRVWQRIKEKDLPAYFSKDESPEIQFDHLWQMRHSIYRTLTKNIITNNHSVSQAVTQMLTILQEK